MNGAGLRLADITGDGRLDGIAPGALAGLGGVVDAGAIGVWIGGPALVGTPRRRPSWPSRAPRRRISSAAETTSSSDRPGM